jgi:hypothetical protein
MYEGEGFCSCDYDGDQPEFYNSGEVKRARKQHRCGECGGPIFVGEPYDWAIGKWDGRVNTHKECVACVEMRQWAEISVPCFCCNIWGELHEHIREMVGVVRRDVPGFLFEWGRRAVKLRRRKRAPA